MMPSVQKRCVSAIFAALVVAAATFLTHAAMMRYSVPPVANAVAAAIVAGLVACLFLLANHLRAEGMHARIAMERAVIVAEMNHHVRNAVFPLCLAIQKDGDANSEKLTQDAVERINAALREALTDAITGKIQYG